MSTLAGEGLSTLARDGFSTLAGDDLSTLAGEDPLMGVAAKTADCLSHTSVIQCAVILSRDSVHWDVVQESVVKLT